MDGLKPLIPVFVYKRPEMAMAAVGIAAFVVLMAAVPVDFIEKFGFHLGLGVGVGFLAAGTKGAAKQVPEPRCPDCLLRIGDDSGCGISDAPSRPGCQRT